MRLAGPPPHRPQRDRARGAPIRRAAVRLEPAQDDRVDVVGSVEAENEVGVAVVVRVAMPAADDAEGLVGRADAPVDVLEIADRRQPVAPAGDDQDRAP